MDSSESSLVKMQHCWNHMSLLICIHISYDKAHSIAIHSSITEPTIFLSLMIRHGPVTPKGMPHLLKITKSLMS